MLRTQNSIPNNLKHNQVPRIRIRKVSDLVLIPNDLRKTVVFLFTDREITDNTGVSKKTAIGTAFLIAVIEGKYTFYYAITALHVINEVRGQKTPLYMRIKKRFIEIPYDNWIDHPNTGIAALEFNISKEYVDDDILFLPLSELITDEFITQHQVREGDEVCFLGLFSQYPGKNLNLPIARFGTISLMPYEEIDIDIDKATRISVFAYLIECRSIGGLSGSPVFLCLTQYREPDNLKIYKSKNIPMALLGLVSGHYNVEAPKEHLDHIEDIIAREQLKFNSGLTVVIRSQEIIKLLMGEELVNKRKAIIEFGN